MSWNIDGHWNIFIQSQSWLGTKRLQIDLERCKTIKKKTNKELNGVISLDLFNLYSEMWFRLIGIMRGSINSRYNLNNILWTQGTGLMTEYKKISLSVKTRIKT